MADDWTEFATLIRGPARDLFAIEGQKKRADALAAYRFDDDDDTQAVMIETRQGKDEDGNPATLKRETILKGDDRKRVILTALYGAEYAALAIEKGA